MTTNRLAESSSTAPSGKKKNECPPDMPRGDSEADKAARVRFWLERGDRNLTEAGKSHLCWRHSNGNYWIEERY